MSAQRRLDWAEVRRQGGGFQTGSRGQHFRSQSPALLLRFRSAAPSSTPASGSKNRGGQRDAVPTGPPSKDHQGRQGLGTDGGLSQRPAPRTRPMRHLLPGRKLKPALATQSPASNWPGLRRGGGLWAWTVWRPQAGGHRGLNPGSAKQTRCLRSLPSKNGGLHRPGGHKARPPPSMPAPEASPLEQRMGGAGACGQVTVPRGATIGALDGTEQVGGATGPVTSTLGGHWGCLLP